MSKRPMPPPKPTAWDDFTRFVGMQLATGDYDAHIPFLTALARTQGLTPDESLWLGLLYMGYYTEGSMWLAFTTPGVRRQQRPPPANLPITTQRRNLYGGRIVRHFADLYRVRPFTRWLADRRTWADLLLAVGSLWGNGRWASYTTSELLTHLGGPRVEPTSYEVVNSSGPRKGLGALGLPPSEASAEQVRQHIALTHGEVPMSVLESLLCDWAGMSKGTFYAGRNIDRQQGRILQAEAHCGRRLDVLWRVRREVFPAETLGEDNGWQGIDANRLKSYRDTGAVLTPDEDRTTTSTRRRRG